MTDPADAIIYYVVFLFSTTLHEAAHAWAAARGGDLTAYHGGQVSLSPLPHIRREPVGMVVLPLLSLVATGWPFGFASAPYDLNWARRYPRRAGLMALAGPAANLALALIAVGLIKLGILAGWFNAPPSVSFGRLVGTDLGQLWPAAARMVGILFSLNLLLCIFNLLPFPPLDGAGALPLVLSPRATRRFQDTVWGNPVISLIGILIAWQVFPRIFEPIFFGAVRLIHPGMGYR
jgi:Zn-dependent protease